MSIWDKLKNVGLSVLLAIVNPKRKVRANQPTKMGAKICQNIEILPAMTSTWLRPGINKKFSKKCLEALEEKRVPDPQHRGDRQALGKPGDEPLRTNGHQIHIQTQQLLQSAALGEKSWQNWATLAWKRICQWAPDAWEKHGFKWWVNRVDAQASDREGKRERDRGMDTTRCLWRSLGMSPFLLLGMNIVCKGWTPLSIKWPVQHRLLFFQGFYLDWPLYTCILWKKTRSMLGRMKYYKWCVCIYSFHLCIFYLSIYLSTYPFTCLFVHVVIRLFMYLSIYIYIYVYYIYVYVHIYIYIYVCIYICICMYVYIYVYIYICIYICIYIYYVYIYICIYIYIWYPPPSTKKNVYQFVPFSWYLQILIMCLTFVFWGEI